MGISELFKKILIFFDTPGLRQQGFETDYSNVDLYHFQSFSQSLLLFSPDFSSLFLVPTSNWNFLMIFAFLEQCLTRLGWPQLWSLRSIFSSKLSSRNPYLYDLYQWLSMSNLTFKFIFQWQKSSVSFLLTCNIILGQLFFFDICWYIPNFLKH